MVHRKTIQTIKGLFGDKYVLELLLICDDEVNKNTSDYIFSRTFRAENYPPM